VNVRTSTRRLLLPILLAGVGLSGCGLSTAQRAVGPDTTVPTAYRSYFEVAARRCPAVLSAAGLAAQARVESKFHADAVSDIGAQGLMQITPATWARYGTDANGDGRADPFTPADAIATAARINCSLHRTLRDLPGNSTVLRLAAYNAGPDAVRHYRGVPPYPETRDYIRQVQNWTEAYRTQLG
jgi:soluble lytic murein transglycosylase-like protein